MDQSDRDKSMTGSSFIWGPNGLEGPYWTIDLRHILIRPGWFRWRLRVASLLIRLAARVLKVDVEILS